MSANPIVETVSRAGGAAGKVAPRSAAKSAMVGAVGELIRGLASLKLTVFLMVTAVLVILTFTFQLTRMDIWQAKSMHFPHLFVFIPFQTFFPPKWFPDWQNVLGGFFVPSGFSIMGAMIVNLLAAHLSRFRIVGSRRENVVGMILMALGAALATAVIWNGQNPQGFQAEPPIAWTTLWNLIQAGFAICAGASLVIGIRLGAQRTIERIIFIAGGVFLAGVFAFLASRGSAAFIGDSAMRILWQMMQCLAPTLVILFGARQIFGRKAGIVLIHAGVAILMLNEIYVSVFVIEQRIQFFEGEKANYGVDLRDNELAIVDWSEATTEDHVVVPSSRLVPGQLVQHLELPVDIMCVDYLRNSIWNPLKPGEKNEIATQGLGLASTLTEIPVEDGTSDRVDMAGAYIKVFDKQTSRELGTFLVGQTANAVEEGRIDDPKFPANTFTLGDRKYHMALRFKRYYKPYTLTLLDTEQQTYLGTNTPRSFSSKFQLTDPEANIDVSQKVWMNNPLRYRNETFYQANYNDSTGREYSELQVVKNSGWMIPYFCCVFVGIGLVVQFGQTLIGYSKKLNQDLAKSRSDSSPRSSRWAWCLLAIPMSIVAWGLFSGSRQPAEYNGFRMDLLSRVPIVHMGRAKPLDSVARSVVRRASGLESVKKGEDESTRIAAMAWIADVLFSGKEFDQYRLFKIDDPNLRGSLNLEPRKRYRYSIDEVATAESVLRKLYDDAEAKPEERQSAFDHRATELYQDLFESRSMGRLLSVDWDGKNVLDLYYWSVLPDLRRKNALLIAPLPNQTEPWGSLSIGLFCQEMIERAKRFDVSTCSDVAQRVVQEEKSLVREYEIRLRVFEQLTSDDSIRQQSGALSREQWQVMVFEQIRKAPLAELEKMAGPVVADVDRNIDAALAAQANTVAEDLRRFIGGEELAKVKTTYDARLLLNLKSAYQANDAEKFNTALATYLTSIETTPPTGFAQWRQSWETFYNRQSPFYLATICYLIGFLLTVFSLIAMPIWFNRMATAVLLGGWVLHLLGIVMSVGISGRAPVTSLYSSFVFVTCVVVGLFMLVERFTRMGLGNLLGSVLGAGGLLWAWNICVDSEDTFAVLVAVLDTNFWLSTHVICVSLGYAATLAAGALGVTYVLGGLFTPLLNPQRRQVLTRLIYGAACFGLLFSFVGTVLGGLWADDSWGRFWGWDPKENGAVMIVLWNAVVLHARWGGMVRQRGMAALAVIGNAVTAWSWEGVNQLGVGLHAYGASEVDKFRMLVFFWAAQFVIAGLALIPPRFWLSNIDSTSGPKEAVSG